MRLLRLRRLRHLRHHTISARLGLRLLSRRHGTWRRLPGKVVLLGDALNSDLRPLEALAPEALQTLLQRPYAFPQLIVLISADLEIPDPLQQRLVAAQVSAADLVFCQGNAAGAVVTPGSHWVRWSGTQVGISTKPRCATSTANIRRHCDATRPYVPPNRRG